MALLWKPPFANFIFKSVNENALWKTKMKLFQQYCCFLIAGNGLLCTQNAAHRCCECGECSCEVWIQIWAHLPRFIPVCGAAPQRAWLDASHRIENGPLHFNLFWPLATFSTSNAVGINPSWPAHNEKHLGSKCVYTSYKTPMLWNSTLSTVTQKHGDIRGYTCALSLDKLWRSPLKG